MYFFRETAPVKQGVSVEMAAGHGLDFYVSLYYSSTGSSTSSHSHSSNSRACRPLTILTSDYDVYTNGGHTQTRQISKSYHCSPLGPVLPRFYEYINIM